jgi:hypothetical protein
MVRLVRIGVILLAALLLARPAGAQKKDDVRFGFPYDPDNFAQGTAKQCLASVIKAIDKRRVDYLMAQLADPAFVDMRVKQQYGGDFREMVRATEEKIASNPTVLKELRRFLSEGEWEDGEETATVKLKDVKRVVFLKKIDSRWYFENRQKPKEEAK